MRCLEYRASSKHKQNSKIINKKVKGTESLLTQFGETSPTLGATKQEGNPLV